MTANSASPRNLPSFGESVRFCVRIPPSEGNPESFKSVSVHSVAWILSPVSEGETIARREAVPEPVREEARIAGRPLPETVVITRGSHMAERSALAPGDSFSSALALEARHAETGTFTAAWLDLA